MRTTKWPSEVINKVRSIRAVDPDKSYRAIVDDLNLHKYGNHKSLWNVMKQSSTASGKPKNKLAKRALKVGRFVDIPSASPVAIAANQTATLIVGVPLNKIAEVLSSIQGAHQ